MRESTFTWSHRPTAWPTARQRTNGSGPGSTARTKLGARSGRDGHRAQDAADVDALGVGPSADRREEHHEGDVEHRRQCSAHERTRSNSELCRGGAWVGSTPSNRLDTDSPSWMRLIASANSAGDGAHLQLGPAGRRRDGVGGDHLGDHRVVAQPLHRAPGEQPVGAGDGRLGDPAVGEPVEQLDDRATGGDLVVEDDGAPALDVTDDRVDDDAVVAEAPLASRPPPAGRAAARTGWRPWRCPGRARRPRRRRGPAGGSGRRAPRGR